MKPAYEAPKKQPTYEAPKKLTYDAPKKPTYTPPKPKPKPRPAPPKPKPVQKQKYQANAPTYVPAPKHLHKPPIIIYQGVAPPVHVYEKSTGGYSPVAQAKSDEGPVTLAKVDAKKPVAQAKSGSVVSLEGWNPSEGLETAASERKETVVSVGKARSADIISNVQVGASVSVKDEGVEILTRKGTVEDMDPKAD